MLCYHILNINKGAIKMGLVTRRSEQLDRLFDQFAIDPKKKQPKKADQDAKTPTKEQDDQEK
ncbi:hypothetical protein FC31_GL001197 [Limosilactobacillus antri DSM 16041]|uniref:Uncharacterized protein n=1 Tax=Limosilactobacillus antri DSM 16041 TaxID=525309 RepID=A0ABR5P1J0_9LACO|nr:hypothetical protein FC31_GL001197 [Limosilactobacillus antri DSM 16041]